MAAQSSFAKVSMPARIAVGVGLSVLIGLGYWVVFYSDISAKIESAKRQQNQLRSDLSTQQAAQASYFADRDELAMRQQRQRELNKALPPEAEAASFLSSLQTVANVSGVDLRGWQPLEEKAEQYYARVPMKVEMVGKFHQVAKFALEAGRTERIINLENIEISDPKLEGDGVVLKAKCTAIAFHAVKPKPQAPKPGAAPAPPPAPPGGKK
jgi:type IV pilus assembly protein PilO